MNKVYGCKVRLTRAKRYLQVLISNRGLTEGLFWQDLPSVDEAIRKAELNIIAIEKELQHLMNPIHDKMMIELKASEIF